MLVLTRKIGESIHIGDEIVVKVMDAIKGHIRIGINAPPDVSIHREEIYDKIKTAQDAAARGFYNYKPSKEEEGLTRLSPSEIENILNMKYENMARMTIPWLHTTRNVTAQSDIQCIPRLIAQDKIFHNKIVIESFNEKNRAIKVCGVNIDIIDKFIGKLFDYFECPATMTPEEALCYLNKRIKKRVNKISEVKTDEKN